MKYLAVSMALILASTQAFAEATIELRVSATIAPRPCEVSETCESEMEKAAPEDTRVVVDEERIQYVGPKPEIIEEDGVTTILF